MTAEDVKFSFERVLEPGKEKKKSPQYGNIRAIKEVKIVDAETIQLVTDKPFPLLLERVVFFPIVPKKHVEKVGDEAFGSTAAVGTGPWKLVEWKRDQYIRLEAFDRHWRGKPAFKYLVFRGDPRGGDPGGRAEDGRRRHHPQRQRRPHARPQEPSRRRTDQLDADPARALHLARHAERALRQEGRAPGRQLRHRQAGHHPEDDGGARPAGGHRRPAGRVRLRRRRCSPTPTTPRRPRSCWPRPAIPNGVDITLHSAFGRLAPALRGPRADADRGRAPDRRSKMWDPGPAWNKFFQTEGKATNGQLRHLGQLLGVRRRRGAAPALSTPSRVAGSASTTRAWKASTSSSTRRARPSTRPSASGSTRRSSG